VPTLERRRMKTNVMAEKENVYSYATEGLREIEKRQHGTKDRRAGMLKGTYRPSPLEARGEKSAIRIPPQKTTT